MTLAIFDLCDTLYAVNTTQSFIAYHARRTGNGDLERKVTRWTNHSSSWFWAGALIHRLTGRDVARASMIAGLRGEAVAALRQSAKSFATEYLPKHANAPILDRLLSHKQAGDRVVIATSSIDLVAEEVASTLGVEYVASTFVADAEGRFRGLGHDLTGHKLEAIARWRKEGGPMTVYSDNRTDAPLLEAADMPLVVIPRGKAVPVWAPERSVFVQL